MNGKVEPRVIIVTGMSGAGRSQAAKVLEDLGFFVVDNLPPTLIVDVVDRVGVVEGTSPRMATVVDTRGGVTPHDLDGAIRGLLGRGVHTTVLFLDADDATLGKRFEETRRTHPIAASSLSQSIAEERKMRVDVVSFGFKRGVPRVVDLLFDVRFLPNPHWIPELRPQTGLDEAVSDYVLSTEDAGVFCEQATKMLDFLLPRYEAEGKKYLTIAIGCTGGRHRSVAIAEELAGRVGSHDVDVTVRHRDLPAGTPPT